MLAVQSGRIVGLEELIDELWPVDPPASAVPNVRMYAANLRRLFDATAPTRGLIRRQGDGYLLQANRPDVDLNAFLDEAARLMRDHTRMHPLREHAQTLLIRALSESGNTVAALSAYTTARRALVDELGIEPGVELQRVHQAALSRDAVEPAGEQVADAGAAPTCWLPRPITDFTGRADLVARIVASTVAAVA